MPNLNLTEKQFESDIEYSLLISNRTAAELLYNQHSALQMHFLSRSPSHDSAVILQTNDQSGGSRLSRHARFLQLLSHYIYEFRPVWFCYHR